MSYCRCWYGGCLIDGRIAHFDQTLVRRPVLLMSIDESPVLSLSRANPYPVLDFTATRVTHLGVGVKVGSLDVDEMAEALHTATRDTVMIERAAMLGEKIRGENGVQNAISVSSLGVGF
jgi:hypothetical protein